MAHPGNIPGLSKRAKRTSCCERGSDYGKATSRNQSTGFKTKVAVVEFAGGFVA